MAAEEELGFHDAMRRGEVVPFLRGDGVYRKIPQSDFAGEDAPTDSWLVLQEIYAEAKVDKGVGKVLSVGLHELLAGSAGELYLALLYLVRLVLARQGGRLPLELPLEELLLTARSWVGRYLIALSGNLSFPNGYVKKSALADIKGWNEAVFLPCCGVDVLSGERSQND